MENIRTVLSSSTIILIIGGLLGALLSWLASAIRNWTSNPNLVISPLEDSRNTTVPGSHKFLHLSIVNKKKNSLSAFLFGESAALMCKVRLHFYRIVGGVPIFSHELLGRWTSTREPLDYNTLAYDLAAETLIREVNIAPGESDIVAFSVKFYGEVHCYAFTNESYLHDPGSWRPRFKHIDRMIQSDFLVRADVSCDKRWISSKYFVISNSGIGYDHFRISQTRRHLPS